MEVEERERERDEKETDRAESSFHCDGTTSLLLHLTALSQFALCDFKQ